LRGVVLSLIMIEDSQNRKQDTMSAGLAALPLPFMTFILAIFAGVLLLRQNPGPFAARLFFAAFLAVMALGSLMLGLRFGYGMPGLITLQRALPLFLGPLLYLGFASLSAPPRALMVKSVLHLTAAITLVLLSSGLGRPIGLGPGFADATIATSYLTYTVLLARIWWRGPNGVTRARLEVAAGMARWAGVAAGFLMFTLIFDMLIAAFFARQRSAEAVALISVGAVLMTALLLAVIYRLSLRTRPPTAPKASVPRVGSSLARDPAEVLAAAQDLLNRESLFVDTALTADRLARRLRLPTRALSEAVNQRLGISISQYVNGFRLRRAAELLAGTDLDLATVMAQSGFLTRSNFYREFQREYAQTPVAYRAAHRAAR
jgi:AraC-like DNA-binding protein